ncbi:MAG: LysM peptidoglycan-binding domain-containing protein [Pseudomonadota bacterium]
MSLKNTLLIGALAASLSAITAGADDSQSSPHAVAPLHGDQAFMLRHSASWLHETPAEYRATLTRDQDIDAPAEPTDLIDRMRHRFTLPVVQTPRTMAQIHWYARHPEYLNRVFNRARPYLHHIVGELEARDMPAELALLPIVESAFDPFAYSHGRAAGLWQIIPGTGRRFGLEQNWWYDGRRDVIAATDAALRYLSLLAKRYDGDYELAVAAYNSGEGTVDRAIRRNKKAGKPTDFWSLKLPRETSAYVPKLLALADIVATPSSHGLVLPQISDVPMIDVVDVGTQIDLALAAELAGIDIDTLYRHNPGFNQWATAPDGPHSLVVPIEAAAALRDAISALPDGERMRWKRHKIKSGQTLSHIAQQYRTTTETIRSANNLKGNAIREGRYLMIPTASQPLSAYSQSAAERLDRKQSRARGDERIDHTVSNGESLWTIAKRYGVSTASLARWNGMAPRDTLSVGKKLVIWRDKTTAAASTNVPATAPGKRAATTRKVHYTVKSGDSLARIAARFRVAISDIARWNDLNVERILRPGQRLTMFVDVRRQSS